MEIISPRIKIGIFSEDNRMIKLDRIKYRSDSNNIVFLNAYRTGNRESPQSYSFSCVVQINYESIKKHMGDIIKFKYDMVVGDFKFKVIKINYMIDEHAKFIDIDIEPLIKSDLPLAKLMSEDTIYLVNK